MAVEIESSKILEWATGAVAVLVSVVWGERKAASIKQDKRIETLEKEQVPSEAITEIKSLIKESSSDARERDKVLHQRISDIDKNHTERLDKYVAETNSQLVALASNRSAGGS